MAVGLYGDRLKVGYGSMGGWDSFGPDRVITRAEGNVLYELDGQSALSLYKKYLGDLAAELPGSALLFPLSIRTEDGGTSVVRTILSVTKNVVEGAGAMGFASLAKFGDRLAGRKVGIVFCGGNIDSGVLRKVLNKEL